MLDVTIKVITNENKEKVKSQNFQDLYSQLTHCELLSEDEFKCWLDSITDNKQVALFCMFLKNSDNSYDLIGTACLYMKHCYYRFMAISATIEDLVIDKKYRKNGLGKKLIDYIVDYSQAYNIYKILLHCDRENKDFYLKCGFKQNRLLMEKYFI